MTTRTILGPAATCAASTSFGRTEPGSSRSRRSSVRRAECISDSIARSAHEDNSMKMPKKIGAAACGLVLFSVAALAQKHEPLPLPPPASAPQAEFLQTADQVLNEMSKLLSLPVQQPLKKSVRSRQEIRDYLVQS